MREGKKGDQEGIVIPFGTSKRYDDDWHVSRAQQLYFARGGVFDPMVMDYADSALYDSIVEELKEQRERRLVRYLTNRFGRTFVSRIKSYYVEGRMVYLEKKEEVTYPNLWLAQTIANADLMGVIDTLTECIANGESMKDIEDAIERAARTQADDMLYEGWTSDEIAEVTMNEEDDQRI